MTTTTPTQRAPIAWDSLHPSRLTPSFSPFPSRRSQVLTTRGVAASAQPLASAAAVEVLNKGGNAADAAVAAAAALNVTEPCSTGIGGDAFCLYYDAGTKSVRAFNGSGRAPAGMTLEKLRAAGVEGSQIPFLSIHAATVPGAPACWVDTIEQLGSGKVALGDVLAPAIRLAEGGYPVHEVVSHAWVRAEGAIRAASPSGGDMLLNGKAPRTGEIMKMPHLGATFRELAEKGKDGFYRGRVADAIVELVQSKGGFMSLEDLAEHAERGTEEVTPISYTYGGAGSEDGVTLHECPPNGQGLTALIALGILDALQDSGRIPPLESMKHNSAAYLHVLIEALRLAFADTMYYVADPAVVHVPVAELLSKPYLAERAKLFDPTRAIDVPRGKPASSSDTVYLTVTDEAGNACSFINSNYAGFGTCALPRGCGFTLQNRGSGFYLPRGAADASHPNALKPGKRPYHTIIPALATRASTGELFVSYGVMGGYMQPQGHVQVLLNLLRGYGAQASLDAPRFCIGAGMPDQGSVSTSSEVFLEEGIEEGELAKLREMGHTADIVRGWERAQFGRGQVIQRIGEAWAAGSDPRADGAAVPQV